MVKNILIKQKLHLFLLLVILVTAVANRFYGLDRLSLWADELWVVMESSKGSLLDMFSYVYHHDNHPPGHYLLTRYWQMMFGNSDYSVRFPFAVAGVFLVYSTYAIAKEHYSAEAGLISAALISSSWQAIYYSQEARANILVAVAALWSLNYFYRLAVARLTTKTNLIGFWLTAALCCYLHYVGSVFVACLALVYLGMLLSLRQRSFLVLGLKLFLPVLLLYSPWMPGMYYHLTHKPPGAWWSVPEWNCFYENFKWIFGFGEKIIFLYQGAFMALVISLLLQVTGNTKINLEISKAIDVPVQKYWHAVQFSSTILLMTVLPPLVFFVKSKISQPAYDYRHFIFILPYIAMAAGWLVSLFLILFHSWARKTMLAFFVIAIILVQNASNIEGSLYLKPHFKAEYRQTVAALVRDRSSAPAESALIVANSDFFNHYLQRALNGQKQDFALGIREQIPALAAMVKAERPGVIYFLEVPEEGEKNMDSLLDLELAKLYRPLCRTQFIYAQIIKFSTETPVSVNWDQLPDCNQVR